MPSPKTRPRRHWSRRSARRTSDSSSPEVACADAGSARRTTLCSAPSGTSPNTRAVTCRNFLETACLVTALPTAFDTTSPIRGPPDDTGSSRAYKYTTTVRDPFFRPRRTVSPKSEDDRSRCSGGSTVVVWVRPRYAVTLLRPLRRRAETMARPARVLIRARKPCLRERRRLLGWKVRLPLATVLTPSNFGCHGRPGHGPPESGPTRIAATAVRWFGGRDHW